MIGLLGLLLLGALAGVWGEDVGDVPVPLSAEEVRRRWHSRLDGRHFIAQIRLEMNLGGMREERRVTVYRADEEGASERVMLRFEAPPDLRNVALLYLENPDRSNDYFFYQPATRRIRRLPKTVADDDVYGIDLEFLGFGVAQTEPTEIESMRIVKHGGRAVYKLTERARRPNPRFEKRITWLDASAFVPVRTEHIRSARKVLIAKTEEIRNIQGIVTPIRMSFEKPIDDEFVTLRVDSVDYDAEIPDNYFSTLALIRARLTK